MLENILHLNNDENHSSSITFHQHVIISSLGTCHYFLCVFSNIAIFEITTQFLVLPFVSAFFCYSFLGTFKGLQYWCIEELTIFKACEGNVHNF